MVDVKDIEEHFPGLIDASRTFFRVYKVPDGKPYNTFAFNGECKDKEYAKIIVQETHEAWQKLIQGHVPSTTDTYKLDVHNTIVENSPYKIKPEPASSVKQVNISSYKTCYIVTNSLKKETFQTIKEEDIKEYDPKWYFV